MKKVKKVFFIILILLIQTISFNILILADTYEENSKIRVGWFTLNGYQFIDTSGNHNGYGYEYYEAISRYTNWKYEYISGSWQDCLNMLENGEIDILSFVQYTEERAKVFDYSSETVGNNYAQLTVLKNNKDISIDNFKSFDNKVIGAIKSATQIEQLEEFADENNFNYTLKLYDELNTLISALNSGEIDMLLHNSFRVLENEEVVVSKFSPKPLYIAVKKGNKELLKQINNSLQSLQIDNPIFSLSLTNKYFSSNSPKSLVLNQEEKDFLRDFPVLRIVASPDRKPLSYYENNEFKGINADIIDEITKRLGIEYEYIPTKSYKESLQLIQEGKADIICAYYSDYSWAEQNNVYITSSFMPLQYSMVSRKENLNDNITVAAVKGLKFSHDYIELNYPSNNITWYKSVKECVDAVANKKQDITFTTTYVAENYLRGYSYNTLSGSIIPYKHYISFATSRHLPMSLNNIIDKALISIGNDQINAIIANNTLFQEQNNSLKTFLYRNPVESIFILSTVSIIIMILLATIIYSKTKYNNKIEKMLYIDDVTQYYNYRKFKLKTIEILNKNPNSNYAIIYMDIQKFKYINDTFGHNQGDMVLQKVTGFLKSFVQNEEAFSRIYADHFVILLRYDTLEELDKRLNAVSEKAYYAAINLNLSYNILFKAGVYLLSKNETDIEKAVDLANYAKDLVAYSFKNNYIFYDEKMRVEIQKEKELEKNMYKAIENREFEAYFQPRIDVFTKKVVGAEALVRWNHPSKKLIFPDSFIPIFEKNGFIIKLDIYMFEETCKCLRKLLDEGKDVMSISCNFSRIHLNNENLPEELIEIAQKYNVPTNKLEIELTETIATDNFELAIKMANKLKAYGFLLSIDDFGSGYSSIQIIHQIPLDVLKLDKTYIQSKRNNKIENEIIKSLIDISNNNHIIVICEGVENQEQEDFVKNHNCKYAQGYLYSKPIKFVDFKKFL